MSLLLKVPPKLRSELLPAISSTATHQTCFTFFTTLTALMGAVLTPAIAAGSIYRCDRILKIHDLCWEGLVENVLFWERFGTRIGKRACIPRIAIAIGGLAFAGFTSVREEEYCVHWFPRQSRTCLSQRSRGTYILASVGHK